jgi:MFS family permease
LLAISGAALCVGFGLMAAAPSIAVAVLGAALGGAGNGIESVAAQTALQEYTPQRWTALVMSLNQSIAQAAPGLGILLGGVITSLAGARLAFAVAAAGSLLFACTVWIVFRPSATPGAVEAEAQPAQAIVPTGAGSRETLV